MGRTSFTQKQVKELKANPYTYKVTADRIWFTINFKEAFWIKYQAGNTPRKVLTELGYDVSYLGQKRIDGIVQKIKKEAIEGKGFTEGANRRNRVPLKEPKDISSPQTLERMQNELLYLRQEVEFLKKIIKTTTYKQDN